MLTPSTASQLQNCWHHIL